MPLLTELKTCFGKFALSVVEWIVAFKRSTERLLPGTWRIKPEGNIALERLIGRFPRYLAAPQGGVVCGEGWYPVVWDLCTAIEALEHLGMPRVAGVHAEERLGGLFLRAASSSFIVTELTREAELKAAATCETCGKPGSLKVGHGFAKTLCSEHGSARQRPRQRRSSSTGLNATPKLIFLDTEFTDLDYPQLISIGLVSDTGERFYAELSNGWSREGCSAFVREHILPQLTAGEFLQERYFAGCRLADWIVEFGGPVRVVTDAPGYDWVLMLDLLEGNLPDNLCPEALAFYCESFPALVPLLQEARQKAFASAPAHHALNDAEALREAWEVMTVNLHPAILDQYLRM
ncbi:hypothetical protein GMLC_27720 [Geomonas limicola]|uniref:Uncharacterized protein n=1 Tax=Geomonas limicola TaxID=2740186 RepID=A0A6V8NCC1_9BACT|nr:3'-5' exoribonuclease [Geomonas limicola]GFO69193.1 hypothetical protein GMLC_27720 [Geomonas limicola]